MKILGAIRREMTKKAHAKFIKCLLWYADFFNKYLTVRYCQFISHLAYVKALTLMGHIHNQLDVIIIKPILRI